MSAGKYSPTVTAAYMRDQEWHRRLQTAEDWHDDEGYDSYGYHKATELDRAGHSEWDYLGSGEWIGDDYCYPLLEHVYDEWTFDGVRPVKKGQ